MTTVDLSYRQSLLTLAKSSVLLPRASSELLAPSLAARRHDSEFDRELNHCRAAGGGWSASRKLAVRGDEAGVERGDAAGDIELLRTPVRSSVRSRSFSRFRRARSCNSAVTCVCKREAQARCQQARRLCMRPCLSAHAVNDQLLLCFELILEDREALL